MNILANKSNFDIRFEIENGDCTNLRYKCSKNVYKTGKWNKISITEQMWSQPNRKEI